MSPTAFPALDLCSTVFYHHFLILQSRRCRLRHESILLLRILMPFIGVGISLSDTTFVAEAIVPATGKTAEDVPSAAGSRATPTVVDFTGAVAVALQVFVTSDEVATVAFHRHRSY